MIIVATLGFDERPVVRTISEKGFEGIAKIYLIRPLDDDPRASKAIAEIKKIASIAGVSDEDVVSFRTDPRRFWESVSLIHDLITSILASSGEEVMFLLGGGLRALILEAYTAFLLIPRDARSRIKLRIDLEIGGQPIILDGGEIPIKNIDVSDAELRILEVLAANPGLNLTGVSDVLVKPTSTIHKSLKKMLAHGLLVREGNKYYLSQLGRIMLRIMSSGGAGIDK